MDGVETKDNTYKYKVYVIVGDRLAKVVSVEGGKGYDGSSLMWLLIGSIVAL